MSLTKKVYLTISGYDIKLSDNLTFYQKDQLKLIFYINEYGIDYENNATTRTLMPVNPLNAILFIENPDGVDSVSSAKIEDNAVTFYLDSTHTQYVGVSRMQLRLFDQDGCAITLPHFTFEIRENIYGSGDVRFQNVVMVDQTGTVILTEDNDMLDVGDILTMGTEVAYPQVTKTIKELPIKHGLDGTEKLIVEDNEATKQAPLGTIVDEIKQNSQEKIREIESELNQTNAQLSVANKRIDELASLSEGSTTGDAELIDGRICYDGHIYNSIGEAIRHQINKITNCIALKETLISDNLIDSNYLIGYPMSDVLKLDSADDRYYSDFIQISPLAKIRGDGVNLRCIVDFNGNELDDYHGFNIEYHNSQKELITHYQIWNFVISEYPVTGAEFIRIVADKTVYDKIKNFTLKSFSLGFGITAAQLYNTTTSSKFDGVNDKINKITNCIALKETLISDNLIDSNYLIGYPMSDVLKLDSADDRYYSDFIQISPLAEIRDGVNLRCIVDFNGNELDDYHGFNIEYHNSQKELITHYQIWNFVISEYPVTGAEFIRIVADKTVYDKIKNFTLKSFSLGFGITAGQLYNTTTSSKFDDVNDKINNYVTYDNIMRSINRIGYNVYSSSTPPQQSVASFKMAYKKGFRILLCDLRFTSDNVPVLHHDSTINSYAKNNDGSDILGDVIIANSTYNDLLSYDYGIYKGSQYKGTKIMTLQEMLKLCRNLGCELYIEVKAMNEEQCKLACDLVKAYRMVDKTSWSGTTPQMKYVVANIDTARVSTMPQTLSDEVISDLVSLKTGKNKVFVFGWDTTVLSKELVKKLIENDLEFEMGTIDTEDGIKNYFNQGDEYYYCTGISSNSVVAGKVLETK